MNNKNIILYFFIILLIILIMYFLYNPRKNYSISESYKAPQSKAFIGAWSGDIECGQGLKYVSLSSALPQNWSNIDTFFSGNINGYYSPSLSDGYTKYFISIGGSNATVEGWTLFLNNPTQTATTLYNAMQSRGIVGVDFDLENVLPSHQANIKILVSELRKIDSDVLIMYTILLGQPNTFADLINDNQMDFVTLMLYNGGMYIASGSGAGCNWDQWAEMFLSECQVCNCQPLYTSCKSYCETIGNLSNYKNKIVIGLITDTVSNPITDDGIQKAMELAYKYNAQGIFFWVLPGWANPCSQENICVRALDNVRAYNSSVNNYFDVPSQCPTICPSKVPGCCPASSNGCQSCNGKCVATLCGTKNNVTDALCAPCVQGKQSWWPCDVQGVCQCSISSSPDKNMLPCPNNPNPCKQHVNPPPIPINPIKPIPPPIPINPIKPIPPLIPVNPIKPIPPPIPINPINPSGGPIYVSIQPNVSNEWCQTNCTHVPPFCPSIYCKKSVPVPINPFNPIPPPKPINRKYISIQPNVSNEWCQANCTHVPPFCPSVYCKEI